MKKVFLLICSLCLLLGGCGSETSGTLSVTAPSYMNGIVTAIATFTPSSGTALPGQEISFRYYTVGLVTKTQSAESSIVGETDGSGRAFVSIPLPLNRTESLYVYVLASTQGLKNKEGWQSVLAP